MDTSLNIKLAPCFYSHALKDASYPRMSIQGVCPIWYTGFVARFPAQGNVIPGKVSLYRIKKRY